MTPRPLNDYFATCTLGLESVLADELRGLRAFDIEERRGGVAFRGDDALGWRANLCLRSATRVQQQILSAFIKKESELYGAVERIDWERYMSVEQTLAVDASVRDSCITHSGYAALLVKDAIVDVFRAKRRRRPSVDTESPDLELHLVLKAGRALLYRNLSGESLHKRGYRPIQVKSPLNEATAAGLILLSGWKGTSGVVDPMCGSATFLIEAAFLALDRAPGLARRFAFERFPDFDRVAYEKVKNEVRAREKTTVPIRFEGGERHEGALSLAQRAIKAAGVGDVVSVRLGNAADFEPSIEFSDVFVNPPYGERLEEDDYEGSWRELGNFLHRRCGGKTAHVLCGNPDLPKLLGLKASRRHPIKNGPIDCRWLRYDIFERKPRAEDPAPNDVPPVVPPAVPPAASPEE